MISSAISFGMIAGRPSIQDVRSLFSGHDSGRLVARPRRFGALPRRCFASYMTMAGWIDRLQESCDASTSSTYGYEMKIDPTCVSNQFTR